MFRQLYILEVKVGERIHRFECEPNSPRGEVHDVLCAMKAHNLEEMKKEAEQDKPKEECMVDKKNCKDPLNYRLDRKAKIKA